METAATISSYFLTLQFLSYSAFAKAALLPPSSGCSGPSTLFIVTTMYDSVNIIPKIPKAKFMVSVAEHMSGTRLMHINVTLYSTFYVFTLARRVSNRSTFAWLQLLI
jgi:hypothetical protein